MNDQRAKNLSEALIKFREANPMVSSDSLLELVRQSAAFTRGPWSWSEIEEAMASMPAVEAQPILAIMAEDPDHNYDNERWVVAFVPAGYDPEQALSDCLERQVIANACIDWYNERKTETLIEAEAMWPEPKEEMIERPKWRAGIHMSEITTEMRAERDRINAHNEKLRKDSLEIFAKRNEHARNRALEQTNGKYPDWAVKRAHDKWKSKSNRKYTIAKIRPVTNPTAF